MMRRLAAATVTVLLSAAALAAGTASAQASASTRASMSGDRHGFTVRVLGGLHLKRVDTKSGEDHVTYLLCTSTQTEGAAPVIHGLGGLKDSTSACEELAKVDGDFDRLLVHPTWLPPMVVAPVDVRAAGTWQGRKVAWSHEYQNGGALAKVTGDVFGF